MNSKFALLTTLAALSLNFPATADRPAAPASTENTIAPVDANCEKGLNPRSFLLQGKAVPTADVRNTLEVEIRDDTGAVNPKVQLSGRVVVIGPNGVRQKFPFGNPSGKDLKKGVQDGGAHLELKLAPDTEALDALKNEIEASLKETGVSSATLKKVLAALKDIDALGDFQIRGLLVDPNGKAHELKFGDDLDAKPKKFDKKMENGGAQLELGVAPNDSLKQLLQLLLNAPEALPLLQQSLRNPATLELLNSVVGNPEMLKFFKSATEDPRLLQGLQRAMDDPIISALLAQGLNNDGVAGLLNLFGGSAKKAPEEKATEAAPAPNQEPEAKTTPPRRKSKRDAEIDALRQELATQRALLEKILEKLGNE